MGKAARWLLGFLLALVALLAAVVVLIESPWARSLLEEQVSEKLNGREVEIGELDIDWGLPLGVRLEKVRIANPDWAPNEHMLDLAALEIAIDPGAWLQGQIGLERLHFQKPRIHLAKREDGTASWAGLTDDEKKDDGGGVGISPDIISVNNGQLTYRDPTLAADVSADFRTQDVKKGPRKILLDGQGSYQDKTVSFSGRGGAPSEALGEEGETQAYPFEITGELGELQVGFDGRLRDVTQPLSLEGDLTFDAPREAALAALLNKPALDLPSIELQARLRHEGQRWSLDRIDAQVGDSAISGALAATLGERPSIKVQLAIDKLALERWGVTQLGSPAEQEQAEQAVEQKVEEIAWDKRLARRLAPMTRFDAQVDVKVDSLSYARTRLRDVALKGGLEKGRLKVERLHARQGEGEVSARGWLEVQPQTLNGNIDAQLDQLDLGRALQPLGYAELGILDGELHVRLRENTVTVDETSLAYRAPEQALSISVNAESADISGSDETGVRLRGEGRRRGVPFTYDITVGPLLDLNEPNKPYPVRGRFDSRDTSLQVNGTLQRPLEIGRVQASFQISGPNPARLNRLTGLNLPALPPYSLNSELRVKDDLVRLLDLSGTFGDSDVSGDVRLRLGERNMLWATLHSRRLDLDDLAPLVGGTPEAGSDETLSPQQQRRAEEQARTSSIFPEARWNLSGMRRMDADVVYSAANVDTKYAPLSEVSFNLTLENGVLTLDPLRAGLGGGRLTSRLRMNAQGDTLDGSLDLVLRQINLKPLLRSADLPDIAQDSAGTIGGEGQVRFAGVSMDNVMAGLDGKLELAMSGGRLDMLVTEALGFDLGEALTGYLAEADQVPMRCAYTRLDATDGQVAVEQFYVNTADSNVTGGGSIDLDRERLNLVFEAHAKDPSLLASDSPIRLEGPLRAPSVDVTSRELIARGVLTVLGALVAPPLAILTWVEPGTGEGVGPGCQQVLDAANGGTNGGAG